MESCKADLFISLRSLEGFIPKSTIVKFISKINSTAILISPYYSVNNALLVNPLMLVELPA